MINIQQTLEAFAHERLNYKNKIQRAKEFCKLVKHSIYPNLDFNINYNSKYNTEDFLDLLTHVAMTHDFTQNGSKTLKLTKEKSPMGNSALYHIKKFDVEKIMQMFKDTFENIFKIAKRYDLFRWKMDIAIDLHDWMYYGNPNDSMVVGAKCKNGTKWAFRFATLNIVVAGKRFTLMVLPMSQFTTKEYVLERLITYAQNKIKIGTVYADRGFFNVMCLRTLDKLGVDWMIPAIQNEKIKPLVEENDPLTVLDYTIGDARYEKKHTSFKLVIVKSNKDPNKKVAFATNKDITSDDAQEECDKYSNRWGIETSYRVKGDFRPRTTSKAYVVRLFYFIFSVCLYNLWILANIFIGAIFRKVLKKPLITAKMFGTILYTTYLVDCG